MKKRKNARRPVANVSSTKQNKVVVLDIETAPALAYTFGLYNVNISLEQVLKPTSILSVSWKFLGDGNPVYFWSNEGKKDPWDDYELCQKLWGVINDADATVTHNGTRFDLPLIYGRFYSHGLPPVRKPQSLDTLTMAKQVGKHFSGKLAYLSSTLSAKKSGHAKFPGFALWAGVLAGNKEAWREMEDYNNKDVLATEQLFKALLPYSKTSYAWSANADAPVCPKCGSTHLQKRGFVATITGHYQRFKCLDCGGWSQSRHTSRDRGQSKNFLKAI